MTQQPNVADPPARRRSRPRRWTRRLIVFLAVAYLLIAGLLHWFQELLIFPGSLFQGTERAHVVPAEGEELITLSTPAGEKVIALYSPALTPDGQPVADASNRPVVLFFYGNGECIQFDRRGLQDLRRLGFNVLVPDYPGYGMSGGEPSARGLYQTADACYTYLTESRHVPPARIAVMGRSIGGSPAIYLAARHPVAALATVSAFRSLGEIAGNTVHHLFPTSLVLRHHLDNLGQMPAVQCPAFLAHGTQDELVPFNSAASLGKAAGGPVTLYPIESATHNDVFEVGGEPLFTALDQFLHRSFQNGRPAQ